MKTTHILILSIIVPVLCGCEDERAAREINTLRRNGHWQEARQRAIEALTEESDRMLTWRELAYTDEALSRDKNVSDKDGLRYLKESALICAAVCSQSEQLGQDRDFRWFGLATLLRTELNSRINSIMGRVQVRAVPESKHFEKYIPEGFEDWSRDEVSMRVIGDYFDVKVESDPEESVAALREYSELRPLALRLPLPPGESNAAGFDPTSEIKNWAASKYVSDVTATLVYDDGEKLVGTAFAYALEDLRDYGYLQLSTIVNCDLLKK